MLSQEHQATLRESAAQWRAYGASSTLLEARALAERTAANLERQAEGGVATCVCCNKQPGQHAGILKSI